MEVWSRNIDIQAEQSNLLDSMSKISKYGKDIILFLSFMKYRIAFVSTGIWDTWDVDGNFAEIGFLHEPSPWRFKDSSICSLKGVLLCSGNQYLSIPVAHSTHLKVDYSNVKFLL